MKDFKVGSGHHLQWVGLEIVVEGHDRETDLLYVNELTNDVVLDAAIESNDVWTLALSVGLGLLRRH